MRRIAIAEVSVIIADKQQRRRRVLTRAR